MIEIYDEEGYIKEVIEHGLSSDRWMRDLTLLVRYWKGEGKEVYISKKRVKDKAREKCQRYVRGWNDNIHYKNFNTVFEAAWKNKEPLRKIKSIEFTEDVLNWFLGLESLEISEDKVKELKAVRPKVTIKKQVMNERRVRFLFTLFVWSKIQENYLEKYNMHYLRGYEKKFKKNADLNSSFNLKNERNLLFDLGYININHALGIDAIFMNNDVFKIPVTDENRIVLSGEDLYNCGYWLEKQKYGYYVCQNCGKEVLKKNRPKGGRPNKYCPDCMKKIIDGVTLDLKEERVESVCEICGREIGKISKYAPKKMCYQCRDKLRSDAQKKYREMHKKDSTSRKTPNLQTIDI